MRNDMDHRMRGVLRVHPHLRRGSTQATSLRFSAFFSSQESLQEEEEEDTQTQTNETESNPSWPVELFTVTSVDGNKGAGVDRDKGGHLADASEACWVIKERVDAGALCG